MAQPKTGWQGDERSSIEDIYRRINGYGDLTVAFTAAATAKTVAHSLGRVPSGFQKINSDRATSIYSTVPLTATKSSITLYSSNSNATALVRVF